jgi:hypothetical protein
MVPYWRGKEKLCKATVTRLVSVLKANPLISVGVIVDEVQAITHAVAAGLTAEVSKQVKVAELYFRYGWHNWLVDPARLFVRLDIASSHGEIR